MYPDVLLEIAVAQNRIGRDRFDDHARVPFPLRRRRTWGRQLRHVVLTALRWYKANQIILDSLCDVHLETFPNEKQPFP